MDKSACQKHNRQRKEKKKKKKLFSTHHCGRQWLWQAWKGTQRSWRTFYIGLYLATSGRGNK